MRIEDRLVTENGCLVVCDNTAISKPEWLKIRKDYINGTDAGKIAGVCSWGNKLSVYLDKTIAVENKEPDNWFKLNCGNIMEPLIAQWYQKKTGYKVENVNCMLRHPTIEYMAGDMDYIAESPAGEIIGIEIKTTDEMNVNKGKFSPGILGQGGVIPEQYEYQVRHYMAVTGINRFIVLICYGFDAAKVIPVMVYRDAAKEQDILEMEEMFWNNHIVMGEPPSASMMKADLKTVQRSLFDSTQAETEIPDEAVPLLEQYFELNKEKKKFKDMADETEEQMNAIMAEICRLSKGAPKAIRDIDGETHYEVINKIDSRTTVDSSKLKLLFPEQFDICKKVSESEQTKISIKKTKKKGAAN